MPDSGSVPAALTSLRQQIEGNVKNHALDLAQLGVPGKVVALLQRVLGVSSVTVTEIGWSADGTGVMVAGQLALGPGNPADIRASFAPSTGAPALELLVILAEPVGWRAKGIPLDLEVTGFALASAPDLPLALTLWAQIGGAPERISVVLELPGADGEWLFTAQDGSAPVTLSRLTTLLGLDSLAGAFPLPLDAVGLTDLSIACNPGSGISSVSFAFATTEVLPLIGDVKLDMGLGRVSIREPSSHPAADLYFAGLFTAGEHQALLEANLSRLETPSQSPHAAATLGTYA